MSLAYRSRQLQRKYKHAGDFGVGGAYNVRNAQRFREAVDAHVDDPTITVINGVFARGARQGGFRATFYLTRSTRLVVVADAAGYFVTGYQLSGRQVRYLLRTGTLGGGT